MSAQQSTAGVDQRPVVAAFDFDGTMTRGETLFAFLYFALSLPRFGAALMLSLPVLVGYGLGLVPNDAAKERVLRFFLNGLRRATLEAEGARFAGCVLVNKVRPEALARLRWHQAQGHQTVLISASLDLWVRPWAEGAGFDHVLCTELAHEEGGVVSGRFGTPNCHGEQKLVRLRAVLGDLGQYRLVAYGDSRGDHALLAAADEAWYRQMPSTSHDQA